MLTRDERNQCIKFQDAIGEIVDAYLREGMHPDWIKEVLKDEAEQIHGRFRDLEADK
ncbi:MAG TPA: hypothetical protein VFX37_09870 [Pseudolabrys sp.]|nr:hypothetical protein [Pseudolabrys sp.]